MMPNELSSCAGVGCSYGPFTANASATVGCWGAGICNPNFSGRAVDVSFYQAWACGDPADFVSAKGGSVATPGCRV